MSSALFDDIFEISSIDNGKYDRVSRIIGKSTGGTDVRMILDINSEIYPVSQGDNLTVCLVKSLAIDDEDDDNNTSSATSWRPPKPDERSLANEYDYVMHGTMYKFEESSADSVTLYASFGGLLLCLEGDYRRLAALKHENMYLLIRR
ncbi:hypothetical protein CANCADRAFT_32678 [Tortispora caseinolytica NRRL Y-17796]|uniref:DNA-directed RNA polymerases I, II, and III subunit RPABC3 n=1 Tax=Tortispora caseinolytica NRRL Y-17796 TaxID=767744 RepID=A0A1E4TCC3_9ASCO|nr:hypothetical protein CANCADRAFT_32678 [Tortispora caseinolytica NRRL Y-17796]